MKLNDNVLEKLKVNLGPTDILIGDEVPEGHRSDWLTDSQGQHWLAVAFPRSTDQVSAILKVCHEHDIHVLPQGGLTGLVGGASPTGDCLIISLRKMQAISSVFTASSTIETEAGARLQHVQETADRAGMFFPLDIGARGSCTIGGNISTNAGGNRVLRYGMMRDLVLGLEVVLADGTILSHLNHIQKDNTGYDLKQLFIGSEGTLGIVTKAVLRVFPKPICSNTAFAGLRDFDDTIELLQAAKKELGSDLVAYEVMWQDFYQLATGAHGCKEPLSNPYELYVLMESYGADEEASSERFLRLLGDAMQRGIVQDAIVANSLGQAQDLWELRDSAAEFPTSLGEHGSFDVSISITDMQCFVDACKSSIAKLHPEVPSVWFGHIADGNLHACVQCIDGGPSKKEIQDIVYENVRAFGGSISAEHGIGITKKPYLNHSRSTEEIRVMKVIKSALDPNGILNPGKIF